MVQLEDRTLRPQKYVLLVYTKYMKLILNDLKVIKPNTGLVRLPGLQHTRNPPHPHFLGTLRAGCGAD